MTDPDPVRAAMLRSFVSERDVPCPGCGYNLRGLKSSRCPECDQHLVLELRLAEPRLAPWLMAVAGAFAGAAGAGALLLAVVLLRLIRSERVPDGPASWMVLYLPTGALITCGLCALRLCQRPGRVWFRSLERHSRLLVILGCWLLSLAWFGGMMGIMLFWH